MSEKTFFSPELLKVNFNEVEPIFRELADNFQRSETKTAEVQDVFNEPPIPCLNQLRYAGYHLCQAISKSSLYGDTNALLDQSHLLSSYKHCLRAYYDALDFSSVVVDAAFKDIQKKYFDLLIPIQDHFPEYNNWILEIQSISKLRGLVEENSLYECARDKTKREQYYTLLDRKIKIVLSIYEHIPLMTEKLSVLAKIQKNEDRQRIFDNGIKTSGFNLGKMSLTISIIALIVAVCILFFGNNILNTDSNTVIPKTH